MKRRQAIRHLGFGFSSAAVGASWLASCKKEDPLPEIQYDGNVIVIGAGAAGLYTADILMTKGLNVTVLEASGQIGGRISSLRNQENLTYQSIADFPVELGAEYWQGSDSVFGKIIGNLGLTTVELTEETRRYILGTTVRSAADWSSEAEFVAIQNFVAGLENYTGPATSVKDAAGSLSANGMALLNGQAGNFYGSTIDRVGVKGLAEQLKLAAAHEKKYFMLKANAMQALMTSRFSNVYPNVKLKSPVKSINYGSDPIRVVLEDGTEMTATKVIVTVPLPILKAGITFSPGLPAAKTSAMNSIGFDPSMRVIIDFKKNFWGTDSSMIWGGTTAPQYFNAGFNRSEFSTTLSITINGAKALELSNLNNSDQVVTMILAELDKLYANQATQFIRRTLPPEADKMIYYIKDWTKEKYIQGGSSYPFAATTLDHRTALSAPLNNKLFFAGEATDINGDPGTVNGALASAERVSEEVAQSILKVS